MDLKRVFIANLRKFRNAKGISQMKLAELCDTSLNYIGEIEIGRRFPSLPLIEKISQALNVEPFRFFMPEPNVLPQELDEVVNFLVNLTDAAKLTIINRITVPRL
jgi:transcriptional regulator with XRE-family HTH domain